MEDKIDFNIKAHNKLCFKYEKKHSEIYNHFEQKRLKNSLLQASKEVRTKTKIIKALDFGCGAGNITQYLLQMDMDTTASDVSEKFLQLIKHKYSSNYKNLKCLKLNGRDLSNIENNTFDFIATYSVLHHIPDYLLAISELTRILKPGGILYIDHESSPERWSNKINVKNYINAHKKATLNATKFERFTHVFILSYWIDAFKELLNPKYKAEGDIHVFEDDHIEWKDIEAILTKGNVEIVYKKDYLLQTKHCPKNLYNKYKKKYLDTRLLVARKKNI